LRPLPQSAACSDLEQSVRDDVALVRNSPLVRPGTPVRGGIYEVETGKIRWLED
jgi:carbonic anhydrase